MNVAVLGLTKRTRAETQLKENSEDILESTVVSVNLC